MFWLILAIALWGVMHSVLASTGTKDLLRCAYGERFMKFYRLMYNFYAIVSFLPILYLMITLPDQKLYQVSPPNNYWMRVGQGASLFLLLIAVLQTDLLSFIGLRQLFEAQRSGSLITTGLYQYVRHPLYTFSLLILWLSPKMTLNLFIVYAALTMYVLLGIIFEERKLLREFGQDYAKYRSVTPMLIPGFNHIWNK